LCTRGKQQESRLWRCVHQLGLPPASAVCLAYSLTRRMETERASGRLLGCLRTTHYNPQDRPHSHAARSSNAT
jgi:hypothetical protein